MLAHLEGFPGRLYLSTQALKATAWAAPCLGVQGEGLLLE